MTTVLTQRDAERWLEIYGAAWEMQDADALVALFDEDAIYVENPFCPALVGREAIGHYWDEGAVNGQRDISFASRVWAVDADVAIAHWTADLFRLSTDERSYLDGVFRLRFVRLGENLLCAELREWWFKAGHSVCTVT